MLMEANRDDTSGDLFGNLKADVKVTRQTRKRSAADALRIRFFTGVSILARNATYLSSTKTQAARSPLRDAGSNGDRPPVKRETPIAETIGTLVSAGRRHLLTIRSF
jgi:hypothetical protein